MSTDALAPGQQREAEVAARAGSGRSPDARSVPLGDGRGTTGLVVGLLLCGVLAFGTSVAPNGLRGAVLLWLLIACSLFVGGGLAWRGGRLLSAGLAASRTRARLGVAGATVAGALVALGGSALLFRAGVLSWQLSTFLVRQILIGGGLVVVGVLGRAAPGRRRILGLQVGQLARGLAVLLGGVCVGMAGAPFVATVLWSVVSGWLG